MASFRRNDPKPARVDLLFETNRFNISQVKENFINPCCFGEDFATWLRGRLVERGLSATAPGQEDWGWYIYVQQGPQHYFVGVGGNRKQTGEGEWRIMVEKKRSLWERIVGKNGMTSSDSILSLIENILREQSDFLNVRRELISAK
jgi:hypothetical protein